VNNNEPKKAEVKPRLDKRDGKEFLNKEKSNSNLTLPKDNMSDKSKDSKSKVIPKT